MVRQTAMTVHSGTARAARRSAAVPLAGVAALVAVLAGCTAAPGDTESATTTPEPTAVVEPVAAATTTPTEPDTCQGVSQVYGDGNGLYWEREGTLRDLGAREFAQGEVTVDEGGAPVTYTVEPGDVDAVIAERLCAYPGLTAMNHVRTIYPGQVLWLTPDPEIPVLPYFSPTDAPAGFSDIPYQQTMERMGLAVDAGDIDAVRAIWDDELSAMFFNQAEIDSVVAALRAGDLDALRQMFS